MDPSGVEQTKQFGRQERRCRSLWLAIAFVLGVLGVIVFLFTEDMSLSMGWVDRWTLLNVAILAIEILSIALMFKHKKTIRRPEKEQNRPL
jgi:uncharacterized protein YqhQ